MCFEGRDGDVCLGKWPVMVMCVLRGVACDGDVC